MFAFPNKRFLKSNAVHIAIIAGALAISLLQYYRYYFISDDGFISLRYAWNFSQGHGLVWEPGSREFGYTNYLFTLFSGLLFTLGFGLEDGPLVATLISIPFHLATTAVTYILVLKLNKSTLLALASVLFLVLNATFCTFATGLLETSMQTFWATSIFMLVILFNHTPSFKLALAIGCTASLALLTRLDSAVLLCVCYLFLSWRCLVDYARSRNFHTIRMLLLALIIPFITTSIFLLWCYESYDQYFPTTLFIKKPATNFEYVGYGIAYLKEYLRLTAYLPLLVLCFISIISAIYIKGKIRSECLLFAAGVFAWCGFMIYCGGDFIDFRMLVPVMPIFIIGCLIIVPAQTPWEIKLLAVILITIVSVYSSSYKSTHFKFQKISNSIYEISIAQQNPTINRQIIGKKLGELFRDRNISIAVKAAGAVPYYSNLRTIDIYGLNTKDVLNNRKAADSIWGGHRLIATKEYIFRSEVNLILWDSKWKCRTNRPIYGRRYFKLPVLEIPITNSCSIVVFYLTNHPYINELIRQNIIKLIYPRNINKFNALHP